MRAALQSETFSSPTKTSSRGLMERISFLASAGIGVGLLVVLGRFISTSFIWFLGAMRGVEIMKMTSSTSMTSTSGVTLISATAPRFLPTGFIPMVLPPLLPEQPPCPHLRKLRLTMFRKSLVKLSISTERS